MYNGAVARWQCQSKVAMSKIASSIGSVHLKRSSGSALFPSKGRAPTWIQLWVIVIVISTSTLAQERAVSTEADAKQYQQAMVWFKKAEAMIDTPKENTEEQASLFQKAVEIKPDFVEAHFNLGLIFANQKRMEDAVRELKLVRELVPDFEGLEFLLASAYRDLGESPAAIAELRKGLQKKPDDMKTLEALSYLLMEDNNELEAEPVLRKILALDPDAQSERYDLALILQKKEDWVEASEHYQEVLRRDPQNFAGRFNLVLILLRTSSYETATLELETLDQIYPGKLEVLEHLGDTYAYQSRHLKAIEAYRKAVALAGDRALLHSKLGFSHAKLNQIKEAIVSLEHAVGLDPDPGSLYLLADLYAEDKETDKSIAAYQHSLRLKGAQKEVHYNLGTMLAEAGRLNEGLAALQTAIQLDPDYAEAWSNLALVAEKLADDPLAMKAHRRVLDLGRARAINYFRLGILCAKEERVDDAIAHLTRAVELEPDKYRKILREELRNVHSVLDSVRYKEDFTKLLTGLPESPPQE